MSSITFSEFLLLNLSPTIDHVDSIGAITLLQNQLTGIEITMPNFQAEKRDVIIDSSQSESTHL